MSRRIKDILHICSHECTKSNLSQQHAAIIVHRSKILATAHNYYKGSNSRSIHAEVAVIQKFITRYPKRMLQKCDLYVVRMNRLGEVCNSAPCDRCARYIIKYGVHAVTFSTGIPGEVCIDHADNFTYNKYTVMESIFVDSVIRNKL